MVQSSDHDGLDGSSLALRAEEVAGKLKPGSWESVEAMALVSIAKSLASIAAAAQSQGRQQ